jgi:tetratricopeptide (TPR) repeat protein
VNYYKKFVLLLLNIFLLAQIFSKDTAKENEIRDKIKKLGDENYKVREKAIKELNNLPYTHRKILVEELKSITNLEVRDRLQNILNLSNDNLIEYFSEYYLKSQKLYLEKKYKDALFEINKIIEIDEEYLIALALKAQILFDKCDYKECIEICNKLLLMQAKDLKEVENIKITLSRIYIELGEFKKAIELLELLSAKSNNPVVVKSLLLHSYESDKQYQKTEELLTKEISSRPDFPELEISLAWFYIRTNKFDKAKKIIEDEKITKIKTSPLNSILNNLFLQNFISGIEIAKNKTKSFIENLKDKKNVNIIDLDNQDVFFLMYQYYFEVTSNQTPSVDLKSLYNAIRNEDKKTWPYPLLGVYAKEISISDLNPILEDANQVQSRQKKCEAFFYLGLLKLSEKNNAEAKKLFQLCLDQNIWEYVETTAAIFMLRKS